MLTSTQYGYFALNELMAGVQEWIVNESPMIKALPAKEAQGQTVTYNVETALPTVSFLSVGDEIPESTSTVATRTTSLYRLIGDAHTDKGEIRMNKQQDPERIDIAAKARGMANVWETCFIRGRTSTLASDKEFKGLLRVIAEFESTSTTDLDSIENSQVIAQHATSGALTMAKIDETIDAIKPGKPTCLLMSKYCRRKLTALQRASGSGVIMIQSEEFGLFMDSYNGTPIYVSDYVLNNYLNNDGSSVLAIASYAPGTTRTTDYDNTILFALKLGETDITGLQAGAMEHERETFSEKKDIIINRFKWYCGLAALKKFSAACLVGINPET